MGLRREAGKAGLSPHTTSPSQLATRIAVAWGQRDVRGALPAYSGRVLCPLSLNSLPFRPPSPPSPKGIPPWRHPTASSTPLTPYPKGCFTTGLNITKCPLLSTPVSLFSLFPLPAHQHTRMFQIKPKLRTTKISLLIATIVPNKSSMPPLSMTLTALPPPSTDSSTRVSATTV